MGRSRSHGRILRAFLLLLLLAVGVAAWAFVRYQAFADAPVALVPSADPVLSVEPGDGFLRVLAKLRKAGVTQGHDLEWKALALQLGVANRVQVGDYSLAGDLTPRTLLEKLARGDVIQQRITIIEGWSFRTLRAALAANPGLEAESAGLGDAEIMERLGRKGVHPEGRFLPETYLFTRGTSDLDILRRAAEAMDEALADAWQGREPSKYLDTPDKLLTLASIVEKETGIAEERPRIAGVFLRRLELGMLLQTDPTVIYGIGESYDGNIRKRDLVADNPYNTYTRAGLPPTPIAMPGLESLRASVKPAPTKALYFVSRGDGSSVFSDNLTDHNRAVNQYQRAPRGASAP
jgi:UPF0755 protein